MSLTPGARLGPYEVGALIGVGGMGEVYRATDTNLKRAVAIKVLPDVVARDSDRLARFQREAEVLASLNHPNIAHVHGLEKSGGTTALVMELVEGPTLADLIAQGPIPVEETLGIARQIAEALEAAHERGVIHRDLKPANVKVRPDGTVKVLDFGLAKAIEPIGLSAVASQSPTITSPAMTQIGVLLGTAAYMSPEQARGKPVDKRADIWAFGCVLYEMLTGRRAFHGADATEMIAAVVRSDPEWRALPADTPPGVVGLLKRCLQKDPKQRLRDIGDARFELIDQAPAGTTGLAAPEQPKSLRRRVWAVGAFVLSALAAGYAGWMLRPEPARSVSRLLINLPAGEQFTPNNRVGLAMTSSASHLVYTANGRMNLRPFDQLTPTPIRGTDAPGGASFASTLAGRNPFFSPDGQWIGFWQAGELKKVSVSGGAPVTLCATAQPFGAMWAPDGTILLGQGAKGIMKVAGSGGTPEVLISVENGEAAHPHLLAASRAVLFTFRPLGTTAWDDAQIVVHSLDTGTRKELVRGGSDARYVATGHLLYVREGGLFAVPFDVDALEVVGNAVQVIEGVDMAAAAGAAQLAISEDGTLAFLSSGASSLRRRLMWVDRQGREEVVPAPERAYNTMRISPDATRVAAAILDQDEDVWVWDFARQTMTRLTFDRARQSTPVWSADSRQVIFNTQLTGLYRRAADGTGTVERLTETSTWQLPLTVSPDGRTLVFREEKPDRNGFPSLEGSDLMVMPLDGERRPRPLVDTPFIEVGAELSPDGRWLAYQSNESGRFEIYVRPFPNVDDGRWQISTGGGTMPAWSRSGQELFYVSTTGDALMSVGVSASPVFTTGSPKKVLDTGDYFFSAAQRTYDISPDGNRFLMIKEAPNSDRTTAAASIIVIQNWLDELKRLVPAP